MHCDRPPGAGLGAGPSQVHTGAAGPRREGVAMSFGAFLVDDDEDIRALMRILIETANEELYVAGEAASGEVALSDVDACRPDAVILDQVMPGLTGVEVARRLHATHPELAVVLCSAFLFEPGVRAEAEAVGVAALLSK